MGAQNRLSLDAPVEGYLAGKSGVGITAALAAPQRRFTKVHLDMFRIVCVDETNGFLGSEWGSDEISLGAFGLNAAATVTNYGPIALGDFDDNTRRDFDPMRRLLTMSTTEVATFPQLVTATFVLAEIDLGGFPTFLNALVQKVRQDAITYLSGLIGGAVGSLAGPMGTIVGLVVRLGGRQNHRQIDQVWEDDLFRPCHHHRSIAVPGRVLRWKSFADRVLSIHGPGHYAIRYQWKLS